MDVAVLGPLEVRGPTGVIEVGGRLQRALLAALLAQRGRTVALDSLVDTLWPQDPPRTATHTLHAHVSRLRRRTGLPVVARDGGYRLDLRADQVDADRFEEVLRSAQHAGPAEAAELLEAGLAMWRGPAYGAAAELPAVRGDARRLEETRLVAGERLVARLLESGRFDGAVTHAEALVAAAPLRESAWAALVRALVAAGRPADGVAAYGRAARTLDELGLLPSADLGRAHAEALGARPVTAAPDAAPVRPPGRAVTSITLPQSSFLGREADLRAVDRLVDSARLVTLVGPGGVGKTRLALEIARTRAGRHASGSRVVELTTLTDPGTVPTAALAALGVGARGGPADRALHVAGELDLLVVMDNCEHLLDAVADVVGHLLAGGRARVLATSRERLGVPGEHVVRVDPLETSGATASARVLFLERAAATGAVEDLTQVDPAAVDRVVRRLDGLPLAIEMAAARTAALTVAELADLLEAELGADTQGELSHPDRFAAERHRTLHGVIAWSRALLDPVERAALTGWPVFAGPVEAQDAVRVLATTRSTVESLSRRSLLLPLPDPVTGRTRYRMLHTVRSALMSEPDRPVLARAAHAHHLVEVARAADAALRGPDEPAAVARLGSVIAELRAAHTWSRAARPELAAELSAALHPFAVSTLDEEVLGWAARLVPVLPPGSPAAAVAQVAMASRLLHSGDLADAVARAGSALEVTDDPRVRLYAYEVLADAAIYDGRLEDCHALGLRLAELAREAHDQHFLGIAAGSVSLGLAYAGDRSGARARLEALRAELESGYAPLAPTVQGWLAYARGEIDLEEDPVAAAACLHRAIRLADSAGNRYLGGVARVSATSLRGRHGDPAEALVEFAGVVRWWLDRGDRTHLVTTLRNLVDVLHRVGDDVAAAELWGAVGSDTLSVSFGAERRRLDRARETLGDRLGEDRLAAHLRAGAERDVVSAAHVALAAVAGSRA